MVVGPNGSGKSNLVDAIVWVLGEQGPAILRSGRMEDVIFGGTRTKPPLGMAEVQLTIDNSAGLLPVAYSEVSIARTLFRSGDSEYRLNGDPCRLLDIQEMLSDAGVGRQQHTIVGQGRIEQVLAADAVQLRGIIEDAAGVGKHRRRKERALRKIGSCEANLVHLADLLAEIRRQLRPLRQQQELAGKRQSLVEELHLVRLVSTARQLARVQDSLGSRPDAGHPEAVEAAERSLAGIDEQIELVQNQRRDAAAAGARQREVQWRLTTLNDRLNALKRLAEERQRSLTAELAANSEAVEQARLMELAVRLEELQQALPEAGRDERSRAAELQELSVRTQAARRQLLDTEQLSAVAEQSRARTGAQAQAACRDRDSLVASLAAAQSDAGKLAQRLSALQDRRLRCRADLDRACKSAQTLEGESTQHLRTLDEAQDGVLRLDALHAALLEQIRGLEKESAVLRARAGARASARRSAAARAAGLRANPGLRMLSDLVELEPGPRRALEALVGPIDGVLVALDEAAAERALADHNPDDAITVLVAGRPALGVRGRSTGIRMLGDRADGLLADVYLVDDLAGAIRLAGEHRHALFITAEGALAMGSFVSRGSREVADAIERCESGLTVAVGSMAELESRRARAQQDLQAARASRSTHAASLAAATEAVRDCERRLHGFEGEIGQLEQSCAAAAAGVQTLVELSSAAQGHVEVAQAAAQAARAEAAQVAEQLAACRSRLQQAAARMEQAQIQAGIAGERSRQLGEAAARVEQSLAAAHARLAGVGRRQRRLSDARDRAAFVAAASGLVIGTSAGWALQAGEVHERTGEQLARMDQQLAGYGDRRRSLLDELGQRRSLVREQDLERSEQQVNRRILEERLINDLQADPEQAVARFGRPVPVSGPQDPADPAARVAALSDQDLSNAVRRLERDLQQLGQVNPLAAEQARALAEREEFLAAQIADVKSSRKDLGEIVESVDARIKVLFGAAFEDVAREYEKLFTVLFPNGRGRLKLTDPTELLESGVEVQASPQGKDLKRLSLLSGGERALSALALLFSIFKARPSPFYILDEVEAALDDVNLQRFLNLLHEFRGISQLLVVSHQKRTMEVADVLYGVALRPDGASRVICERLSERFPVVPPRVGSAQ